jgi:hypothetical protein
MDPATLLAAHGGTLHVVDRLSEPVFRTLSQATRLLQEAGVPQTVLLLDRQQHAHRLLGFSDGVRLVPVAVQRPAWRHWLALRQAVRQALEQSRPAAVHFHGALAWLCGRDLVNARSTVYVSPHGRALPRRGAHGAALPALAEPAVDDLFFATRHTEARRPLIVSGCEQDNRKAVELFCRAAVIFGASELDLAFNWCGPVGEASAARLRAAGVGGAPTDDAQGLATRLHSAWVYFAGGGAPQFPLQLVQAMACGLPCLAADVPACRAVLQDGVTGLLFRSEEEALQLLTSLIDDAALRQRLGEAARHAALQRFSRQRLRLDLMSLYHASATAAELVDG